jgi:hypothetical protein
MNQLQTVLDALEEADWEVVDAAAPAVKGGV